MEFERLAGPSRSTNLMYRLLVIAPANLESMQYDELDHLHDKVAHVTLMHQSGCDLGLSTNFCKTELLYLQTASEEPRSS